MHRRGPTGGPWAVSVDWSQEAVVILSSFSGTIQRGVVDRFPFCGAITRELEARARTIPTSQ